MATVIHSFALSGVNAYSINPSRSHPKGLYKYQPAQLQRTMDSHKS